MNKIAIALVVVAAIVVAGLVFWHAPSITDNSTSLEKSRVGYYPFAYTLPWLVAKEKGFYAAEGLDVEMVRYETPNQILDALLKGDIDMAGGSYGTLLSAEANTPGSVRLFGAAIETDSRNQNAILVRTDSNITALDELRGRRIGTYTGTTQKLWLALITRRIGWNESDYTLVQVAPGLQTEALLSGQFDALVTIEPYITVALKTGKVRVLATNARGMVINPVPSAPLGAFSSAFYKNHAGKAGKLRAAAEKATSYIKDNEADARLVLTEYLPFDADTASRMGLYEWHAIATPQDKASAQRMADILYDNGELKSRVNTTPLWIE